MLIAFVPVCAALTVSFFAIRSAVADLVKAGLRQTFRENQETLEAVRSRGEERSRRLMASLRGHESIKSGLAIMHAGSRDPGGKPHKSVVRTLEQQLIGLNQSLGFDTLILSGADRKPVAGLQRMPEGVKTLRSAYLPTEILGSGREFVDLEKGAYQITSVPLEVDSERVGYLSAGERFDARTEAGLGSAVLLKDGEVAQSSLARVDTAVLESELKERCAVGATECEVSLDGELFLVTTVYSAKGSPYRLLSAQSMDSASQRFLQAVLKVFTGVAAATLALVFALSLLGSQSVAKPLAGLLETLRHAQQTGELRGGLQTQWGTLEVDQLAEAFNQAAESIAGKQTQLDKAYREFVESMARTLDARDPYTAGHSLRVAHYSRAVGQRLALSEKDLEIIETGARLHDIGKIGIPDAVLQKAGRLTEEEFQIIKAHPQIGKRMLKRVGGFEPYLPVVEYHHENHDGSGYPYGMRGKDIPLCARIVHVADAYDAMTSHRTYRKAMPHERAVRILRDCAGSQFDPEVVSVFVELFPADKSPLAESELPVQLLA
jgi:HD superfamily phosphohydrolase YqeK